MLSSEANSELNRYIIDDHTEQLRSIKENAHKVNEALIKQGATLDEIIRTCDERYDMVCSNTRRVTALEERNKINDAISERKKAFIKDLFSHWKYIILTAFILLDLSLYAVKYVSQAKLLALLNFLSSF
jgi:hypothetical protein